MISEVELGKNLRRARSWNFLSLVKAAEIVPCAQGNLGSYERGVRYPPMHIFLRLCEMYHKTPNELLGMEE